jgi:hypothetical protein
MTSMKKKFLGLFLGWRLDTSPQVIAAYGWAGVFLALLAFGGFWWFYEGCMISIGQLEESLDIHSGSHLSRGRQDRLVGSGPVSGLLAQARLDLGRGRGRFDCHSLACLRIHGLFSRCQ